MKRGAPARQERLQARERDKREMPGTQIQLHCVPRGRWKCLRVAQPGQDRQRRDERRVLAHSLQTHMPLVNTHSVLPHLGRNASAVTGAVCSEKVTKQKPLDSWNSLTCAR